MAKRSMVHKAWCNAHGALQHGEPHGAMAMEHGAQATWEWCTCTRHNVQGIVRWYTGHGHRPVVHGALGMEHRAWEMLYRAWCMCRVSQTMVHRACCMMHDAQDFLTPLHCLQNHRRSPSSSLPINASEIRDIPFDWEMFPVSPLLGNFGGSKMYICLKFIARNNIIFLQSCVTDIFKI